MNNFEKDEKGMSQDDYYHTSLASAKILNDVNLKYLIVTLEDIMEQRKNSSWLRTDPWTVPNLEGVWSN